MAPGDLSKKHFICRGISRLERMLPASSAGAEGGLGLSEFSLPANCSWSSLSRSGEFREGLSMPSPHPAAPILLPANLAEFLLAVDKLQSNSVNFYSGLLPLVQKMLCERIDSLAVVFQVEVMILDGKFLKSAHTNAHPLHFWEPLPRPLCSSGPNFPQAASHGSLSKVGKIPTIPAFIRDQAEESGRCTRVLGHQFTYHSLEETGPQGGCLSMTNWECLGTLWNVRARTTKIQISIEPIRARTEVCPG